MSDEKRLLAEAWLLLEQYNIDEKITSTGRFAEVWTKIIRLPGMHQLVGKVCREWRLEDRR